MDVARVFLHSLSFSDGIKQGDKCHVILVMACTNMRVQIKVYLNQVRTNGGYYDRKSKSIG